ncbi:MAG TPA: hypothetical protein ENN67_02290, partial [Firmicutes bacterium]|nr:hypothetical protein [Bacillota bacterium]
MPDSGYSRMEMIRVSPRTGDALTRLNVFEGQILRGHVYKVEPLVPPDSSGGGTHLAKIALGSHLIEAVVTKPLPEGSHVTLEVLRLADDSFILKLISLETDSQSGRGSGIKFDSSPFSLRPDIADLSIEARDSIKAMQDFSALAQQKESATGIIAAPDFASLPRAAASVVRTAIGEGFVNPATFSPDLPVAKVVIQTALDDFIGAVARNISSPQLSVQQADAVGRIADSIRELASVLRPMIASLPAESISVDKPVAQIAKALIEISSILRPALDVSSGVSYEPQSQQASQTVATGQPTGQTQQVPAQGAQAQDGQAITIIHSQSATASPQSVSAQNVSAEPKIIFNQDPAISKNIAGNIIPDISAERGISKSPQSSSVQETSSQNTRGSFNPETSHPARELLFGLRLLSHLAEKIAVMKGWTIEQASGFRAHSSRLATLADAWEGTLIAPLISRSIDVPDAIPRILMNLLFPGGTAEFGVMKAERESPDGSGRGKDESADDSEVYIGIIRI